MLLPLLAAPALACELAGQLTLIAPDEPFLVGEQIGIFVAPDRPIDLPGAVQATVVLRGPGVGRRELPIVLEDGFIAPASPYCDPAPDDPFGCGPSPSGVQRFDGAGALFDPLRDPGGGSIRAGTYRATLELPDGHRVGPVAIQLVEHEAADLLALPRGFREEASWISGFRHTGTETFADGFAQKRTVTGDRLHRCASDRGGGRACVQITEPLDGCDLALSKHTRDGEPVQVDGHALWRFYEGGETTRDAWCSGERLVVVEVRGPDATRAEVLSRVLAASPAQPIP